MDHTKLGLLLNKLLLTCQKMSRHDTALNCMRKNRQHNSEVTLFSTFRCDTIEEGVI